MLISCRHCQGGRYGLFRSHTLLRLLRLSRLLSIFARGVASAGVALLLALAVLVGCDKLFTEWRTVRSIGNELPSLQIAMAHVLAYQATLVDTVKRNANQISEATLQTLDARIRLVEKRIRDLNAIQARISPWSALAGSWSGSG
jgi:hypothetical protein